MADETPWCLYSINSLRGEEVKVFTDQREQTDVTKNRCEILQSARQNINIQITRGEHVLSFGFQCTDEDADLVPGFYHSGSSEEDWSNAENESLHWIRTAGFSHSRKETFQLLQIELDFTALPTNASSDQVWTCGASNNNNGWQDHDLRLSAPNVRQSK